jgi:hypothetical protein
LAAGTNPDCIIDGAKLGLIPSGIARITTRVPNNPVHNYFLPLSRQEKCDRGVGISK